MWADSRFAKPRYFPKGKRFYSFRLYEKNPKYTRGLRPSGLRGRFKTLWIIFFAVLPALVPIPVYGATHFFGCFEPVQKGYCTSNARLMLFGNGMSHCKLTGANVFKKGGCTLFLLRRKFIFAVRWLEVLNWIKALYLSKTFVLSKKATHSYNPIASHSMSVITYCYQRNPLRVRTQLHILFYYAWSSQRFKSLPSIFAK